MKERAARTRGQAWKSTAVSVKERQLRALDEMQVVVELHQVINAQCWEMASREGIISVQLEIAFQRAQHAHTQLEGEMDRVMTMELRNNDVSEAYSPPRVFGVAGQFGLAQGWGLDLTVEDGLGNKWGFSK